MLYRKAIEKFEEWKKKENKKALLVTGARQIGKTFLIREFAHKKTLWKSILLRRKVQS